MTSNEERKIKYMDAVKEFTQKLHSVEPEEVLNMTKWKEYRKLFSAALDIDNHPKE